MKAILKAEPWWLLAELSDRLGSILEPEFHLNGELVLKCLGVASSSSGDPSPEVVAKLGLDNRPLNREQKGAVLRVLGSEAGFVWGPPATGKTRTAGETIAALHGIGESLLAMAHTNVAVDTLTLAVAKAMAGTEALNGGEILRLGTPRLQAVRDLDSVSPLAVVEKQNPDLFAERDRLRRSVSESSGRAAARRLNLTVEPSLHLLNLQSKLVKIHTEISDLIVELICRARVILTTFAKGSVCELVYTRRFDASMVDEASMAMLAQVAFSASLAQKRIAIFGDFRQLPPIVRARTRMATEYLGQDLFAVSGIEARANAQLPDPRLATLRVQYRMAAAALALEITSATRLVRASADAASAKMRFEVLWPEIPTVAELDAAFTSLSAASRAAGESFAALQIEKLAHDYLIYRGWSAGVPKLNQERTKT